MSASSTPVLFLLLVLLLPAPAHSADEAHARENGTWVGIGLGKSSMGRPSGQFNLTMRRGTILFGLRGTSSSGGSYKVATQDDDYDLMNDFGLVVGLARYDVRLHASVAVGVARVRGTFHDRNSPSDTIYYKADYDATVGLPIEAQFIWKFSRNAGLGAYGYMNTNRHRNFGGLCLSMMFGKL